MTEHKRMCQRSGTYEELTAAGNSLLQDEMLVVESGDPNTTTGRGLYMCYPEFYGSRKERLRFASEELSADDIAEGSITNNLMADDSVDTNNIIDGSITHAKFASSVGFGSGYSFICSNTGEIVAYSTGTSTITSFQPSGYTVPANYYVWLDKGVNSISSSALTRDSSHVLSRIYAENENVDLSGIDTTGVTVYSGFNKKYKQFIYSSLANNSNDIKNILDDIDTLNSKFPIDTADIKRSAVTLAKLNSDVYENTPTAGSTKLITSGGANTALAVKMDFAKTESIFETLTNEGEIYQKTVDNIDYYVWIIKKSDQNWVQFRCSVNGLEYRTHNTSWGLWDYVIPENAIGIDNLANALLITSTSAQVLYDDYHLPTTRFMNDSIERKVENPSKIVYFDTNGCICLTATAFSVSSIYGTAYSMVVPNTITTIPDSILTFLPNVDTVYVDRSTIDLGTNVQTAVQNEDITIRYKGEYNLADLFANSQKKLNDRLTTLENTVGAVNTMLENSLNGV